MFLERPNFAKKYNIIACVLLTEKNAPNTRLGRMVKDGWICCIKCGIHGTHVVTYTHTHEFRQKVRITIFCEINHGMRMMTQDHILPRSLGGSNRMTNLQPMCENCNRKKQNKVSNQEILNYANDWKKYASKKFIQNRGFALPTKNEHPLAGWINILAKYPQLDRYVRFC